MYYCIYCLFIRLSFSHLHHLSIDSLSVCSQGMSALCILIGLQPVKLLLQHADSLQQLLPVLPGSVFCLLLHLHELPLVPTLQLSRHRLKETLSHLVGKQQHL